MPKSAELSQEEVFDNDIDPLDAIRELRREEGVPEEDLIIDETPISESPADDTGEADLEAFPDLKKEEAPTDKEDETPAVIPKEQENDEETGSDETASNSKSVESKTGEQPAGEGEAEDKSDTDPGKEQVTESEKKTFRANGQDFEFTQDEMLAQFETVFGQAMDYTQKMQKIAPYRKMISALESEGVSHDQLNIAISALKGDKSAIQELLKLNEIDNYDLTPEEGETPYTPTDYGKNETQLGIEEVTRKIETDEEYPITVDIIDKQWDNDSREVIASNPGMIQGLHNDVKSGVYDKVAPAAMKLKVLDGNTKSDLEYYMLAGEQLRLEQQKDSSEKTVADLNKPAQDADTKFEEASSEAGRKRAAGSTRTRADRKGVIDYLDDDDEAYEAWYKKLQDSN